MLLQCPSCTSVWQLFNWIQFCQMKHASDWVWSWKIKRFIMKDSEIHHVFSRSRPFCLSCHFHLAQRSEFWHLVDVQVRMFEHCLKNETWNSFSLQISDEKSEIRPEIHLLLVIRVVGSNTDCPFRSDCRQRSSIGQIHKPTWIWDPQVLVSM